MLFHVKWEESQSVREMFDVGKRTVTESDIMAFRGWLEREERSRGTADKYTRDVRMLARWLKGQDISKYLVMKWKESLLSAGYAAVTINSMLVAVNQFLHFLELDDMRVKTLRIQRRMFRSRERELTREEYGRLVETAHTLGKVRLALLIETICATGIRVSEVKYITVEAIRSGRAEISLKGKIRTILIPNKLCRKLRKYAGKQKIASGEIFLTRSGKGLSRRQIWAEMKGLCRKAGVAPSKVFPHNLRHLFARSFYRACRDVLQLADVLGHSSVETTRIYLISTGMELARRMDRLGLVFSG